MSFGEMWIDRKDELEARRTQIADDLRPHLDEFVERGYTVFNNAVCPEQVKQILTDLNNIFETPDNYIYTQHQVFGVPEGMSEFQVTSRVQDLFALSQAARDAIATPVIKRFVEMLFDDDVIAMQSLSFHFGSEQAMHQDTAYVVCQKPLHLVACWIALEDIKLGSGELVYYPGSHKFEHFLFANGRKHWHQKNDGHDIHNRFLASLHEKAQEKGIKAERFLAKKGDVLLWHADLAHGGAPITDPALTRKSLVAHYCPKSDGPNYKVFNRWFYHEHRHASGMYFSSSYYDLKPLDKGQPPVIKFDGINVKAGRYQRLLSRVQHRVARLFGA